MKKLFLALTLVLGIAVAAVAQPRAIGVRLGGITSINYQHGIGSGMLDIDLGMPLHGYEGWGGLHADITYDWIFNNIPWNNKGTWDWYAGVGGAVGLYGFDWAHHHDIYVGVAGRIGIEYTFWFPLNLSLDWTPVIGYNFCNEGHGGFNTHGFWGLSLGIRYSFGK